MISLYNLEPLISYDELKFLVNSRIYYEYNSYDHKLAYDEYIKTPEFKSNDKINEDFPGAIPSGFIPDKIKEKYKIKRIGKLRQLTFSPNMYINRIVIGNKYKKTYYIGDFGRKVKPILTKEIDEFNLIDRGIALDANDYITVPKIKKWLKKERSHI